MFTNLENLFVVKSSYLEVQTQNASPLIFSVLHRNYRLKLAPQARLEQVAR